MQRGCVRSIEGEYGRYKQLAEAAMAQLTIDQLGSSSGGDNSIVTLVWHISGNLQSRFTDFLSSDGEKLWRQRDEEFESRLVGRSALLEKWNEGWTVLLAALASLNDEDLTRLVTIRNVSLSVQEALHRSLAHTSYHVGQIVLLGRQAKKDEWQFLSIPPGGSESYNRDPRLEKAANPAVVPGHAAPSDDSS